MIFATSYCKSPCDDIGGAVKQYVAKRNLQRPSLNNQISDYKAMLDLHENEMMLIKSCGICKESMISVENLEIEKWYDSGDTVTVTRSSHHLVSLYPRKMVIIEDESYVHIHGFNVATLEIGNISPSAYVTCIYNSFW